MESLAQQLETITDFTANTIDEMLKSWITDNELSMGAVMNALRLLLVGAAKGPHLGDIMEVIGKTGSLERIRNGIRTLES